LLLLGKRVFACAFLSSLRSPSGGVGVVAGRDNNQRHISQPHSINLEQDPSLQFRIKSKSLRRFVDAHHIPSYFFSGFYLYFIFAAALSGQPCLIVSACERLNMRCASHNQTPRTPQHPASGIRHPASGIRHPASGIRHPALSA